MGGNGVHDSQGRFLVCQLHGVPIGADVRRLREDIVELVRQKAGGAVWDASPGTIEISASLDAQAIELLRLEVCRLARRHGADQVRVRVEPLSPLPV